MVLTSTLMGGNAPPIYSDLDDRLERIRRINRSAALGEISFEERVRLHAALDITLYSSEGRPFAVQPEHELNIDEKKFPPT